MIKHNFQRTRLAPTPSGYLHLGNVLSFVLTAALARQSGARIFLRIDDLDRERIKPSYVQDIFDTLDFLEIPWDEGPRNYHEYETQFSQIHRMDLYHQALQQLNNGGYVFACDCSRSDVLRRHPEGVYTGTCKTRGLPLDISGHKWRINTSTDRKLKVSSLNSKNIQTYLPKQMQYFVVRKRDGYPSYQLASVIDDEHFGVDLIVRGIDLWDSTLAQCQLAHVLELETFRATTFMHHQLLTTEASEKLSKSAGSTSVRYFRKQGKSKADVFQLIGKMLGLPGTLPDWERLAKAWSYANGFYPDTL